MATTARVIRVASASADVLTRDPTPINDGLTPAPVGKRTRTARNFGALWINCAFGFAVLGGMIAAGMPAGQALLGAFVPKTSQLEVIMLTGRFGVGPGEPGRRAVAPSGEGRAAAITDSRTLLARALG